MSSRASMKMRPASFTAWQFGAEAWLMKRASVPPTAASITTWWSMAQRNVWCGAIASPPYRYPATADEMCSPTYSMMRVSRLIRRVANTPMPAMADARTSIGADLAAFLAVDIGGMMADGG